jgi:lipoprotein-releasing system ATP-binding protein
MIEANNIHKTYNNANKELRVLKGIDLSVEKGKFIALVGPSGAGKSTLLHILGGLDIPTEGNVIFEGQDIYKLSDLKLCQIRNRKIGFVFQFYHLLSEFTVLENVVMPALVNQQSTVNGQRLKDRAFKLLEEVGLSERPMHFPSQLSGGEQQRVAIVRALINEPQILFCDEPTGNLDSETGNEIIALVKKISSENKMTVILVTHNQDLANLADRVYHLRDGVLLS